MERLLAALGAALCISGVYADGGQVGPRQGNGYAGAGVVIYQSAADLAKDDSEFGPGLILGFGITDHLAIEVLLSNVEQDYRVGNVGGSGDTELRWVNLLYQFGESGGWQPFFLLGGGSTDSEFDNFGDVDDTQFNGGIGVFRSLGDRWSLRGDVRVVTSEEGSGAEPFGFIGLSAVIGDVSEPPPPDTDGDGVPDPSDRCPNTPPGRVVGADGCELDSDDDGVVDSADACPNTPRGAPVDARGCALDSDGDGVPDYRDECPGSEAGARVDDKGCYIELEETVTIDLNLEFDTNRATLREEHFVKIQEVADFLVQYPTANAVIEGHTDSDGSEAYNANLSQRRARAVYDYLINQAGIDAQRLTYVGYGESRPIASNATRDGKQRNRRVSAVVSGTQKVRQRR